MYELTIDTELLTFSDISVLVKEGIIYELNELGEQIIRGIIKGNSLEEIENKVYEMYNVSREIAREDIQDFINSLENFGLIETL